MTTEKVTDLRWLTPEKTVLGGTITNDAGQARPICVHADYDTEQGREIWETAIKGDYGKIAAFVAPSPTELRSHMPALEKWRVDTMIDLVPGLRKKIEAAIDAWPEPKRTISRNKLKSAATFTRLDPIFADLSATSSVGISDDVLDAMWKRAAAFT